MMKSMESPAIGRHSAMPGTKTQLDEHKIEIRGHGAQWIAGASADVYLTSGIRPVHMTPGKTTRSDVTATSAGVAASGRARAWMRATGMAKPLKMT
jgi:hypothetical protein